MKGRIIKNISNDYTVLCGDKTYVCKCRGLFRKLKITPLVGDNVVIDEKNNYILEIEKRKNELVRPSISNVDQAFIITSVKEPDFSSNLLDKLLVIIEYNSIKPIICFTKIDLLEDKNKIIEIKDYYQKIGYTVLFNDELEKIKELFKNKISVFTGQSGVGKSTLLNKLDSNLNIKTGEISLALGRGRHTTRHVELIDLFGGLVADTPGFSALDFKNMTSDLIRDQFIEFEEYKSMCKYQDCMHDKEDDCEVKRNVENKNIMESRYINYLKLIHKE